MGVCFLSVRVGLRRKNQTQVGGSGSGTDLIPGGKEVLGGWITLGARAQHALKRPHIGDGSAKNW